MTTDSKPTTGPFAYLICDPELTVAECRLSESPMTSCERRDGLVQFPLSMSDEDAAKFHGMFVPR